jgi:hypothetical protein
LTTESSHWFREKQENISILVPQWYQRLASQHLILFVDYSLNDVVSSLDQTAQHQRMFNEKQTGKDVEGSDC